MRSIFAQPAWEPVAETKICSSCGHGGAVHSVSTGRTIDGQQIKARQYCSQFCQRTFETFLFRKAEASDQRTRLFGKRSPSHLNTKN
jgi:hypothetical protein